MSVLQEILTLFLWRNSLLNTLNYQISLPEMRVECNSKSSSLIPPHFSNLKSWTTSDINPFLFDSLYNLPFLYFSPTYIYIDIYIYPSIHPSFLFCSLSLLYSSFYSHPCSFSDYFQFHSFKIPPPCWWLPHFYLQPRLLSSTSSTCLKTSTMDV